MNEEVNGSAEVLLFSDKEVLGVAHLEISSSLGALVTVLSR